MNETEDGQPKTVTARVEDKCRKCGPDDIDLSQGAFEKIAHIDLGNITVSWDFETDSGNGNEQRNYVPRGYLRYRN